MWKPTQHQACGCFPPAPPAAAAARAVVRDSKPVLVHQPTSSLWVPIKEGGVARGALGIRCSRPYAYEDSTAAFLELVSDEVTLALRNARSYEAIEDQRRRLEVVNSIGRRLASSPHRWALMPHTRGARRLLGLRWFHPGHHHGDSGGSGGGGLSVRRRCRRGCAARRACCHGS